MRWSLNQGSAVIIRRYRRTGQQPPFPLVPKLHLGTLPDRARTRHPQLAVARGRSSSGKIPSEKETISATPAILLVGDPRSFRQSNRRSREIAALTATRAAAQVGKRVHHGRRWGQRPGPWLTRPLPCALLPPGRWKGSARRCCRRWSRWSCPCSPGVWPPGWRPGHSRPSRCRRGCLPPSRCGGP